MSMKEATPYERRKASIAGDINTGLNLAALGHSIERLTVIGMSPKKAVQYATMATALHHLLMHENDSLHKDKK